MNVKNLVRECGVNSSDIECVIVAGSCKYSPDSCVLKSCDVSFASRKENSYPRIMIRKVRFNIRMICFSHSGTEWLHFSYKAK